MRYLADNIAIDITRFTLENRYTVIDNFLPIELANKIQRLAWNGEYRKSTVASKDDSWRKSQILKDSKEVEKLFLPYLFQVPVNLLPFCERSIPLSQYETVELQVTRSGDQDFYRYHTDTGTRNTDHRQLTFVWFGTSVPRSFFGGELRIYDQTGFRAPKPTCRYREIAPIFNRLVLFNPNQLHEIITVHLPGNRWSEGRFTVNGWLGCKRLTN